MRKTLKEKAVETAFNWHGGMNSALYSFASCGGVVHTSAHREGLQQEIRKNLLWVAEYLANNASPKGINEYGKETVRLTQLLIFINKQPTQGE